MQKRAESSSSHVFAGQGTSQGVDSALLDRGPGRSFSGRLSKGKNTYISADIAFLTLGMIRHARAKKKWKMTRMAYALCLEKSSL